jgi:epoxyqueuosine reductase
MRNVLIAIGNSGDATLVPEARCLLDDASPLVRGAAVWALSRLIEKDEFASMRRDDADATVNEEWQAALA